MSDNAKLTGNKNDSILIPLNKEKLGNFLSSLLGQPQSIDRKIFGEFDLDLNWLSSLIRTIDTRITRQAKSKLIYFNSKIKYSDNEIRTINSLEELLSYNENFKRYTSSITVHFAYLVEFPDKENPEKQEFEFIIDEKPRLQSKSDNIVEGLTKKNVGMISYRIYYTERTWGDDMDKLIGDFLEQAFIKMTKSKSFLRMLFLFFSSSLATLSMMLPLVRIQLINLKEKNKLIDSLNENFVDTVDWKIEYLYKLTSQKNSIDKLSVIISNLSPILTILILFITLGILKRKKPCFICLTEQDRIHRQKTISKKNIKFFWLIIGYVLSIGIGIISNFLYEFIK